MRAWYRQPVLHFNKQTCGCAGVSTSVKLGYATNEEVLSAIAEFHGMQFVNLQDVTVPPSVIEQVPESVARENVVLPMSLENGTMKVVVSDPTDFDLLQKLQFVLNKDIF